MPGKYPKGAPKGCGPLETRGVFRYRFALKRRVKRGWYGGWATQRRLLQLKI